MKIAILGLGAYGIALARVFNYNSNKVYMWSKFKEEVDTVLLKRENMRVLKDVKIPKEVVITSNLKETIQRAKIIVIATPTSAVREVAKSISEYLTEEQVICLVSKGIEQNSNKLLSDVVYEETNSDNICMLSGPSFASEIAKNKTELGFVAASYNSVAGMSVKVALENENIFVNTTRDLIGVQVSAAIKNVYSILLGIVDGMKKSYSTKACVLTCIINDMRFIIEMLGGKPQTIFTYAGIGDIVLSAISPKSRNYMFGKYIGDGLSLDDAMEKLNLPTIEGVYTLDAIEKILKSKEIEVKSIRYLYNVLYRNEAIGSILKYIKN